MSRRHLIFSKVGIGKSLKTLSGTQWLTKDCACLSLNSLVSYYLYIRKLSRDIRPKTIVKSGCFDCHRRCILLIYLPKDDVSLLKINCFKNVTLLLTNSNTRHWKAFKFICVIFRLKKYTQIC